MEKSKEREFEKSGDGQFASIAAAIARRKSSVRVLLVDAVAALVALLFVRTPLVFGAHPLALALLSVLPERVVPGLIGAVLGAVTLGERGVVYAMTAVITVFLRVIISGSGRRGAALFSEGLLLKLSVSVIGGFAVAVYEVLLGGLDMTSVLFGVTMILAPPIVALLLSGLFEFSDATPRLFMTGASALRSLSDGKALYFKGSALVFIFLVSLSLRDYSALGISANYLFSTAAALLTARSLGAVHGAAVGFVGSLAASGTLSGGFMLAGAVAGAFSSFGVVYSAVFGGVVLALFSLYVGGAAGLASVLPEYAVAAAITYPVLKRVLLSNTEQSALDTESSALDMIGTMALAYKTARRRGVASAAPSFSGLSTALHAFLSHEPSVGELSRLVLGIVKNYSPEAVIDENITKIATKVYNKEKISYEDLAFLELDGDSLLSLFEDIDGVTSRIAVPSVPTATELSLICRILREAGAREDGEVAINDSATDAVEAKLAELGFTDFTARVFGSRHHIILAGRDTDGGVITSESLHSALREAIGGELTAPEYFRRGSMALMECSERARYSARYATVGTPRRASEISGDSSRKIELEDRFYAVVSDGMGTGRLARRSSDFVCSYLSAMLPLAPPSETAVHLLNSYLLRADEECSATLDLFELDLYNREAVFIKSGAAPSYVKRGSSIFRIRSSTAPLGIMSSIDTEKIKVQIERGDYVIMTSDGAHGLPEDAPWLLELISAITPRTPRELADAILAAAVRRRLSDTDDITVTVVKIE